MIEVLEAETPKVKQFMELNHDRSFEANTSRESFASQSDESAVFVNWPLKGRIMSKLDKMNDYDDDDTFVEIGSGDFVLLRPLSLSCAGDGNVAIYLHLNLAIRRRCIRWW